MLDINTANGTKWILKDKKLHLERLGKFVCETDEDLGAPAGPLPTYRMLCSECVSLASAGDFIEKFHDGIERSYRFPTLCVHGHGCGGHRAIYFQGDSIENPRLALDVALLQHGHIMRHWDNTPPNHACDCEDRVKEIEGDALALLDKTIHDSGWKGRSAGRCITDYSRTITFESEPSDEDRDKLIEFISRTDCPGWTGINVKRSYLPDKTVAYELTTTNDSSD